MKTVYPLRLPKELIELSELKAKEDYVDRATALRQLLYMGAEDYVLKLYGEGRISLGKSAELLGRSVHDVLNMASRRGMPSGPTPEQMKKNRQTMEKLLKT